MPLWLGGEKSSKVTRIAREISKSGKSLYLLGFLATIETTGKALHRKIFDLFKHLNTVYKRCTTSNCSCNVHSFRHLLEISAFF